MSMEVQELIRGILTQNPGERPTLHGIVDHDFFINGTVPSQIPRSAHEKAPDFRHISRASSKINLERLRKKVMLDDEDQPIKLPEVAQRSTVSMANASSLNSSVALAQQEREFKKAVQPGSPISALLGAARQPLLTNAGAPAGQREQPLIRKLQAVAKEGRSTSRALQESQISSLTSSTMGNGNVRSRPADLHNIEEENEPETKEEAWMRRKELEAQKARIVAQMTAEPSAQSANAMRQAAEIEEMENVPPPSRKPSAMKESSSMKEMRSAQAAPKLHALEAASHALNIAFEAKGKGKLFRDPSQSFRCSSILTASDETCAGKDAELPDARIFIVSWVDYCNKYGMGYALTDNTVGVHFNDSSTIMLSPDKQ